MKRNPAFLTPAALADKLEALGWRRKSRGAFEILDCPLCRGPWKLYIRAGTTGATVLHCCRCGDDIAARICDLLSAQISVLFPETLVEGSSPSPQALVEGSGLPSATSDVHIRKRGRQRRNNDELMEAFRRGELVPKAPKMPRPMAKGLGKVQRAIFIRVCLLADLRRADGFSDKERMPLAAPLLADKLGIEHVGSVINALRALCRRGLLEPCGTTLPKGLSEQDERAEEADSVLRARR